jgi:hypothetical protein
MELAFRHPLAHCVSILTILEWKLISMDFGFDRRYFLVELIDRSIEYISIHEPLAWP